MSVSRRDKTSIQPARGSIAARLFLGLTAMAMFGGVLVLTRSETAAQSADTAQKTANAPAGNAEHGKTVYARVGCYECHGSDAQSGRPDPGPKAAPVPPVFAPVPLSREDMPA